MISNELLHFIYIELLLSVACAPVNKMLVTCFEETAIHV